MDAEDRRAAEQALHDAGDGSGVAVGGIREAEHIANNRLPRNRQQDRAGEMRKAIQFAVDAQVFRALFREVDAGIENERVARHAGALGERDLLDGREAWIGELRGLAEWDYFIGSVHYLPDGAEVDHPKYVSRYRDGDVEEIWTAYWQTYERAVRSGLFDFMAHPDLPKKFGYRPAGALRRFYEPVIAALAEMHTPFEINTAGWRKDCREQYPAREFLELAHAAQVPLLINSDAHAVEELGAGFADAVVLAKSVGYAQTARFHRRQISFVPLP